jgi:UDP-glucose 4-epimerase
MQNRVRGVAYDVGTAIETSVHRPHEILLLVFGKEEVPSQYGPAKPGEQMRNCVDPT